MHTYLRDPQNRGAINCCRRGTRVNGGRRTRGCGGWFLIRFVNGQVREIRRRGDGEVGPRAIAEFGLGSLVPVLVGVDPVPHAPGKMHHYQFITLSLRLVRNYELNYVFVLTFIQQVVEEWI